MTKDQVKQRILEVKIVPVVRASSPEQALGAADAVREGGIPIVEVTMTVPGAIEVIAALTKLMGSEVLIGAGTVLDAATAQKCLDAGAQFLVSPGFDAETVALAKRLGVLIMPGSLTPTEVINSWKAGADFVKIFPCGNVGGPSYIKALKGPFPQIEMIPTGGVNLKTAGEFLKAGACAVAVGGELVDAASVAEGRFEVIEQRAREYLEAIAAARAGQG